MLVASCTVHVQHANTAQGTPLHVAAAAGILDIHGHAEEEERSKVDKLVGHTMVVGEDPCVDQPVLTRRVPLMHEAPTLPAGTNALA